MIHKTTALKVLIAKIKKSLLQPNKTEPNPNRKQYSSTKT